MTGMRLVQVKAHLSQWPTLKQSPVSSHRVTWFARLRVRDASHPLPHLRQLLVAGVPRDDVHQVDVADERL